jgi:hypothetical protein
MVWLLLMLITMAIVVTGIYLCVPYWRAPEKRWRDAVLRAHRAAERQAALEKQRCKDLAQGCELDKQRETEQAFQNLLASIAVSELEAYPGIGPATVGRLQQAGYRNLAILQSRSIRVRGLGEKRLADILSAIRDLTQHAESRFQSGDCPESRRVATTLTQIEGNYANLQRRARARAEAAAQIGRQLEKPAAIARQVTFWKYFWNNAEVLVPPEWLNWRIPEPVVALEATDQDAGRDWVRKETGDGHPVPSEACVVAADAARISNRRTGNGVPTSRPHLQTEPASSHKAIPSSAPPPRGKSSLRTDRHIATKEAVSDLFEMTVQFAFAVARLDNRPTGEVRKLIVEKLQCRAPSNRAAANRIEALASHYEKAAIDIEDCIRRIKNDFAFAERGDILTLACQVAHAAGAIYESESRLLGRAAREWEVPLALEIPVDVATMGAITVSGIDVPDLEPVSVATPPDPRAFLEIDPSVVLTVELIRRQHSLLRSRFAPEKVQGLGAEFVAMAESKCAAVHAAAEALIRPFGEPLEPSPKKGEPTELRNNPDLDEMFGS